MSMQETIPDLNEEIAYIRQWSMRGRPRSPATVVSMNLIIGDGTATITAGIKGALRVDFKARVTGIFIQEFDGLTGSVTLGIEKAVGGVAPVFTSIITPGTVPTITAGRFYEDEELLNWPGVNFDRGDYIRWRVITVSTFRRLAVCLRLRRKEP